MKLLVSRGAARQLAEILDYIEVGSPQGALNVQRRIQTVMKLLLQYPGAGAPTDEPGTRRVIANPYPYAIFYQLRGETLIVERIRHTARRPR